MLIRYAIIIASDSCFNGERKDKCGEVIEEIMKEVKGELVLREILPDDADVLEDAFYRICDNNLADLILTSGGTGFAPRDVTPEATRAAAEKIVPGFGEAMRASSIEITPKGILSRGISAIRNKTLIVNLPGSPKAVKECLRVILPALPHGIDILTERSQECGS